MNRARVMIAFTLLAVLGPVAGAQAADNPMRAAARLSAAEPIISFVTKEHCDPIEKRGWCKLKARFDESAGYDYLAFFTGRKAPDESLLLSGILHVKVKGCWFGSNEPFEVASRTRRMVRDLAKWIRGGAIRRSGSVLRWRKGGDRAFFRLDAAGRITTVIRRWHTGSGYRMTLRYPAAIKRIAAAPACTPPSGAR